MSTSCLKSTNIINAIYDAAQFSSQIKNKFFLDIEYVSWLEQNNELQFDKDHVICNYYKNGDINGIIIIDNKNNRWLFQRSYGWLILPFNVNKKIFEEFKIIYFKNIDSFDKKYMKYMQKQLLN